LNSPTGDSRSIVVVSLPELKSTVIRPFVAANENDDPTIHALSGPDSEGHIVYVEDHFFVRNEAKRRHLLKVVQIDGSGDTALFSRPGAAMWAATAAGKGEIGKHLALAPTGGRVAFLSGLSNKQMPGALFKQGTLELWDINKKEPLPLKISSLDQPLSWFPDGKKLAMVSFIARKDIPNTGVHVDEFGSGQYTGSWAELPAIYILDIQTGETRFLSLGWVPVVSASGNAVLVGAWVPDPTNGIKMVWKRVDVTTGAPTDTTWPGDAGGPIAYSTDGLILYWGLPTAGAKIKHSPFGSFRRGLMLITIKAAVPNTGRFQTVIQEIDPRDAVSYGQVTKK
jgi:hypothetical protein